MLHLCIINIVIKFKVLLTKHVTKLVSLKKNIYLQKQTTTHIAGRLWPIVSKNTYSQTAVFINIYNNIYILYVHNMLNMIFFILSENKIDKTYSISYTKYDFKNFKRLLSNPETKIIELVCV